ncbi:MAG: hypothetical protein ACYC1M_02590 [Armatimonadota bacterium]
MKKKLLVVLATIALVVIVILLLPKGLLNPKKEPFTFDFKTDKSSIAAQTENDEMATLLACSPFYAGAKQYSGVNSSEFDQARERKVQEIIRESDDLAANAIKMKVDIDRLRTTVSNFITICNKNDPKAAKYTRESGKRILTMMTKEAVAEAQYKSYTANSQNAFAQRFFQYLKAGKAVQLGTLYMEDINNLLVIAALGVEAAAVSANPAIKDAGKKLDQEMGEYDGLLNQSGDLMRGIYSIQYCFKQLKTGDYYFAQSAVTFIRQSLPTLKKTAASLKPNKYMDDKAIAFTKDYLNKFDNLSIEMQKYLDSVPKDSLVQVSSYQPGSGVAVAQTTDVVESPYTLAAKGNAAFANSVADGISSIFSKGAAVAKAGWSGIKTTVHGIQSTVGLGIDIAGTGVANITRIPVGMYYGNTLGECWEDMEANSKQIITNWKNNQSGSSTMRTAKSYFDSVDDGGEYVVSTGVEKTIGKGWISWGTGKVGKAVVGIFTGLGKGIALVGNRDANTSDYVIGTIEIGGAMLGGSKLVIRGTQLPGMVKGLAQSSWIGAQGAWNTLGKLLTQLDKNEMTALLREAAARGMSSPGLTARIAIADAMMAAATSANAALKAEFRNIIQAGVSAGWTNFNATLRSSLNEFVRKQFTANMKGVLSIIGDTPGEFVDNVVAQWADDALKSMVDEVMAEPPQPAELKGMWTGKTLITAVTVPEPSEKAKKQGCNFDEIKKLKGQNCATSVNMSGGPSGAGRASVNIAFKAGKGQAFTGNYTYSNGDVSISNSAKGVTITMKGKAIRQTQGYSMNGDMHLVWGGEGMIISISGDFELTKAH